MRPQGILYGRKVFLGLAPDGRKRYAFIGYTKTGRRIIDPTYQIAASSDDAVEVESGGAMTLDGATIPIISATAASARRWGGLRWTVAILQGSTIDSAHISIYIPDSTYDDMNSNLHFQYLASPAAFTVNAYDITGRARTSNSVAWVAAAIGQGAFFDSASLVTPLQEVVDDFTTTTIVCILRPNTDVYNRCDFRAWDYAGNAHGAKLTVEWTEPAGAFVGSRGFILG